MKKVIDYAFVEWADKDRFIRKVMNLVNDGYELQGGITFNGCGLYCQSLVKYENELQINNLKFKINLVYIDALKKQSKEIEDQLRDSFVFL